MADKRLGVGILAFALLTGSVEAVGGRRVKLPTEGSDEIHFDSRCS